MRTVNPKESYVFGYGSLVSPASVAQTLGRAVDRVVPAHLTGWERAWNVGTDAHSHPERAFYLRGNNGRGDLYTGVTVVLGITPADGLACNGAVFPVVDADLARLDVRERNYERVDVTGHVTWHGKPRNCIIHTYVPRAVAQDRVARARAFRRPLNVRREYFDLVEQAFESVGELPVYRRTTPRPAADMPIVSMETVLNATPRVGVGRGGRHVPPC